MGNLDHSVQNRGAVSYTHLVQVGHLGQPEALKGGRQAGAVHGHFLDLKGPVAPDCPQPQDKMCIRDRPWSTATGC